jgi:hypothetical protein
MAINPANPNENAPHVAGHYLSLGDPGQNLPRPGMSNPIYLLHTVSFNSLVSPVGVKRVYLMINDFYGQGARDDDANAS